MKFYKQLIFLGALMFSLVLSSSAQISLPNPKEFKSDMLGAMIPTGDLSLNNDQKEELKKQNESFLDNVIKIAQGDDSEDKKISSIKDLAGKNNKALEGIFGDPGVVKKYKKKVKKSIRPFKRKYKLATLIL
ncbi:hypothetical protein [Algoriphagus sediminis]|uniref:Uncharacterized protein n=1 Tax=Algoriphagus sediminis TaxID=3057113 RepID=A0ABT7YAB6_9BACT|nr:hypothetical protein [Algoriphagus sediminis]MDN3203467.1 hypothetical protein [Algoriphagus sediminis]